LGGGERDRGLSRFLKKQTNEQLLYGIMLIGRAGVGLIGGGSAAVARRNAHIDWPDEKITETY